MIYVASPYSAPNTNTRDERWRSVMHFVAHRIKTTDQILYSPIIHFHTLAAKHDLPKNAQFWLRQNTNMLRLAERVLVLKMPGWEHSVGIMEEIELANKLYIPVEYIKWPE